MQNLHGWSSWLCFCLSVVVNLVVLAGLWRFGEAAGCEGCFGFLRIRAPFFSFICKGGGFLRIFAVFIVLNYLLLFLDFFAPLDAKKENKGFASILKKGVKIPWREEFAITKYVSFTHIQKNKPQQLKQTSSVQPHRFAESRNRNCGILTTIKITRHSLTRPRQRMKRMCSALKVDRFFTVFHPRGSLLLVSCLFVSVCFFHFLYIARFVFAFHATDYRFPCLQTKIRTHLGSASSVAQDSSNTQPSFWFHMPSTIF